MLNSASSRPLYLQIQDVLLDEIAAGAYGPEGKLPSERELADRFGVSRMTARQALQNLQQRGFTFTKVGKGTYIKRLPVRQELEKLTSFTEDMHGIGVRPHSKVLAAQVIAADEHIAARLKIVPGSNVVYLKRLRIANQQPIAIEAAHIPHNLCPGILTQHDFSRESLYEVLQAHYGHTLSYAEQIIRADVANVDERRLLQIAEQEAAPILRIDRVTFDTANVPIEYVSSVYHGGFYEFRISLRAARVQVVIP